MKRDHPATFAEAKPQKHLPVASMPGPSAAPNREISGLLVSWDLDGQRFGSVSLVLGTALHISCSQVAGEPTDMPQICIESGRDGLPTHGYRKLDP